jgi:hypothetical protein
MSFLKLRYFFTNNTMFILYRLRNDLLEIVYKCFEGSKIMKNAVDYAFEYFMNLKTNTVAELISKHMDLKLKNSNCIDFNYIR